MYRIIPPHEVHRILELRERSGLEMLMWESSTYEEVLDFGGHIQIHSYC